MSQEKTKREFKRKSGVDVNKLNDIAKKNAEANEAKYKYEDLIDKLGAAIKEDVVPMINKNLFTLPITEIKNDLEVIESFRDQANNELRCYFLRSHERVYSSFERYVRNNDLTSDYSVNYRDLETALEKLLKKMESENLGNQKELFREFAQEAKLVNYRESDAKAFYSGNTFPRFAKFLQDKLDNAYEKVDESVVKLLDKVHAVQKIVNKFNKVDESQDLLSVKDLIKIVKENEQKLGNFHSLVMDLEAMTPSEFEKDVEEALGTAQVSQPDINKASYFDSFVSATKSLGATVYEMFFPITLTEENVRTIQALSKEDFTKSYEGMIKERKLDLAEKVKKVWDDAQTGNFEFKAEGEISNSGDVVVDFNTAPRINIQDPSYAKTIHVEFQVRRENYIIEAKSYCFNQVALFQNATAQTFNPANVEFKEYFAVIDQISKIARTNCADIFPMGTVYDDMLQEQLTKTLQLEVVIGASGNINYIAAGVHVGVLDSASLNTLALPGSEDTSFTDVLGGKTSQTLSLPGVGNHDIASAKPAGLIEAPVEDAA